MHINERGSTGLADNAREYYFNDVKGTDGAGKCWSRSVICQFRSCSQLNLVCSLYVYDIVLLYIYNWKEIHKLSSIVSLLELFINFHIKMEASHMMILLNLLWLHDGKWPKCQFSNCGLVLVLGFLNI